MGKGSQPRQQRDDKAYAENWDRIFGGKTKECLHNRFTYDYPGHCLDCGQAGENIFERDRELLDAVPVASGNSVSQGIADGISLGLERCPEMRERFASFLEFKRKKDAK